MAGTAHHYASEIANLSTDGQPAPAHHTQPCVGCAVAALSHARRWRLSTEIEIIGGVGGGGFGRARRWNALVGPPQGPSPVRRADVHDGGVHVDPLGELLDPVQAFPSSIFRDKNRCDIGKAQSTWTAKDGNAWRTGPHSASPYHETGVVSTTASPLSPTQTPTQRTPQGLSRKPRGGATTATTATTARAPHLRRRRSVGPRRRVRLRGSVARLSLLRHPPRRMSVSHRHGRPTHLLPLIIAPGHSEYETGRTPTDLLRGLLVRGLRARLFVCLRIVVYLLPRHLIDRLP
jgi:hypothetical protein